MTRKFLATSVAAVATIGAAATGVTSISSVTRGAPAVQPVVFQVPLPLDPANLPSPDDLANILNSLQDPGVPFANKDNLIQGGVGSVEGHLADRKLQKAAQDGDLPLSFNIANIKPAGGGAVTADVTASGPNLAPTTRNVSFINSDGWKLSRSSAMTLLQSVQG